MDHLYPDMLKVNTRDDITRWWEVIDRTTGEAVPVTDWSYNEETEMWVITPRSFSMSTPCFPGIYYVGPGTYVQRSGKRLEGRRAPDHL